MTMTPLPLLCPQCAARRLPAAAEALFHANRGLAPAVVNKMFPPKCSNRVLPRIGDRDDAHQVAYQALWLACLRWDETRGIKLSTYATLYIQGILHNAIEIGGLIRTPSTHRCDITEDHLRARNIDSLDIDLQDDPRGGYQYGTLTRKMFVVDRKAVNPALVAEKQDDLDLEMGHIYRAIADMPQRKREVFLDYYLKGMLTSELSMRYGVTQSAINLWISQVRKVLWEKLGRDGRRGVA